MKAFFFDLDGTLTDPGEGITNSIMYALSQYGIIETDRKKLYTFIGPPLAEALAERYGFSMEKAREAVDHFRVYFADKGIFENKLYRGIPQLLAALKAEGHQVILATSKPEEFAGRVLKHFDLFGYFDHVCGATMSESRVEKEEVLAYALAESGADPKESFMIGDRKYDVIAGRALGLSTVGVLYGYGSREELEAAKAERLCETVEDLKKALLP